MIFMALNINHFLFIDLYQYRFKTISCLRVIIIIINSSINGTLIRKLMTTNFFRQQLAFTICKNKDTPVLFFSKYAPYFFSYIQIILTFTKVKLKLNSYLKLGKVQSHNKYILIFSWEVNHKYQKLLVKIMSFKYSLTMKEADPCIF